MASTGKIEPRPNCLNQPGVEGGGRKILGVIRCDVGSYLNMLLKEEALQLAEAGFRDSNKVRRKMAPSSITFAHLANQTTNTPPESGKVP